jgi:hypothetical protein
MTNQNDDPLNQRMNQIAADGKQSFGDAWDSAVGKGLARRMASGQMTQQDLLHKIGSPNATSELFAEGMDSVLEQATAGDKQAAADYQKWRDSLPDRKRWRDRQR